MRRSETVVIITVFAEKRAGIECAAAWIADDPVLHAVDRIAGGDRGLGNQRQLRRGQRTGSFESPHRSRHEMDPVVSRVARDDSVIVGRKSLRLRERLLSSGRAAREVGVLRQAAVIVANDQLGGLGHEVDRPIRPVVDFVGVTDAEFQIVRYMSSIRARCSVAAVQRGGHGRITQPSGKSTIAGPFKFSIPLGGRRHPDFEMNFRIGYRSRDGHHSAKFRQVHGTRGSWRRKRAGRDVDGRCNSSIRDDEPGQIRTHGSSRYCRHDKRTGETNEQMAMRIHH